MIRRTEYDAMAIAINIFSCDSIPNKNRRRTVIDCKWGKKRSRCSNNIKSLSVMNITYTQDYQWLECQDCLGKKKNQLFISNIRTLLTSNDIDKIR
ncbi:hypothetical protein DERP_000704 [Dermatophagoides pteronyssinus]|uniref:Uncharacterized protein n=1 Tax=Dermatophagoides pteronyssinus TaxID=6956 RepID=A0ABQ8J1G0_DERPT|nr:hypothetical protein DERP_000704 [Dermatophagoides pteronyssinus]